MRLNLLLWSAISLLAPQALGQQPAPAGTIKEAEFIIEKEKKNRLPESARLFEKAPLPTAHVPDSTAALAYDVREIAPELGTLQRKVKVLRAKQDLITRLYGNYVKGGYGNYHTPYLAGFLGSKRDPKHTYGFYLSHLSGGKDGYAEEHHNAARLHGKLFTESLLLDGAVRYNWDKYPVSKDSTSSSSDPDKAQTFHQIHLSSALANYLHDRLNYQVHIHLAHLRDPQKAYEHQGEISGEIDYAINDGFTLKAITDLYLTHHKDTAATNRHLERLKPTLGFLLNDFSVQTGFNLVYQNDSSEVVNRFNAYPVLEVNYALHKWLRPYVGIGGDMQRTSWQGFVAENPWLAPKPALRHTDQRFVFYGGAKGDIIEKVAFHTGISIGSYKNLHCFVNNPTEPRQFDIQYDPATTLLQVFGELTQTNRAETLTTRLRGDYFHYTLQQLPRPWHRPSYQLDLLSTYNLHDKVLFKGTLYWLGGIEALDRTTQTAKPLADVVDLGLGIDYLWGQRFSIFLNCQNLLARANKRYLYAPTGGFHFLLGLSYAW